MFEAITTEVDASVATPVVALATPVATSATRTSLLASANDGVTSEASVPSDEAASDVVTSVEFTSVEGEIRTDAASCTSEA
ncbi:hypothetical protein ACN469_41880 [Corallococcus terminator]